MKISTIRHLLCWSYANLAMAHAAVSNSDPKFGRIHFMTRAKVYSGLTNGKMKIGPLALDEKLKMTLPQCCSYCGVTSSLSVDHLVPTSKGGANLGENLVWACRRCNSSKGARDVLEWLALTNRFPPLLLLRRYLKLSIEHCEKEQLLDNAVGDAPPVPFSLHAIPRVYPSPTEMCLWVQPRSEPLTPDD